MLSSQRAVAISAARRSVLCASRNPRVLRAAYQHASLCTSRILRRPEAFPSLLENALRNAAFASQSAKSLSPTPQTLTEKIVQRYAVGLADGKKVKSGDYVTVAPHHCMTHDNSWPVALKVQKMGLTKIHNNKQIVMTIDHDVSNKSAANQGKYASIEQFARKHGVDFHESGKGIGHQIMCEEGYAWPGTLTVASDSHSNHYGGLGCLGTAVVRTDAASIWATSKTWWQVPPVAKITLTGVMPPGVTGKDVIVALIGLFNQDDVLNHAVEFTGSEETLRSITIDERMTIANMTTEWGALSGLFPIDSVLISWLRARATTSAMLKPELGTKARFNHERIDELVQNPIRADPRAVYAKSLYLNLSTLSPYVSGPNSVKLATPLRDLESQKIAIDKAYLVSCTNSRASDISAAARVFREAAKDGKKPKVAEGVKFYLAAASRAEQEIAEEAGDWQVLVEAGAIPQESGCNQCIGLGPGIMEPGETAISASNRNFKGRLGSPVRTKAYLASPEVVAASALQGYIAGPGWYQKPEGVEKVIIGEGSGDFAADQATSIVSALEKLVADAEGMIADAVIADAQGLTDSDSTAAKTSSTEKPETLTEILPGFPEKIESEIVFLDADNLNTDGIYPGKYTYQDGITTEKMAEVCMENYDPEFRNIAKASDILVSGFNFGTGSSREQSATAILAKGIPLVVAGSFSNIFSRNSINNALMGLEVPRLVRRLRETFKADGADKVLTRRTGWKLVWDVRRSKVTVTEKDGTTWEEKVGELPPNVQEIIACGGLEKWVKKQIAA